MKRILSIVLVGAAGFLAHAPVGYAQVTYLMPAGGVTVKDIVARNDGWAIVTFVEPLSELDVCGTAVYGPNSYTRFVWIDLVTVPTGKQLYSSVLAASLAGRKLMGLTVDIHGVQNCYLQHVRIAP